MTPRLDRLRTLLRRAAPWVAAAVIGATVLTQVRAGTSLPEGRPAPELSADLSDGSALSLGSGGEPGEIVVLSFWATWCPACREEAPTLSRLHQSLRGRGVRFVGLAAQQGPLPALAGAARRIGMSYPVAGATPEQISAFQVEMLPTTYVIDRRGTIRWSRVGGVSERELRAVVEDLL